MREEYRQYRYRANEIQIATVGTKRRDGHWHVLLLRVWVQHAPCSNTFAMRAPANPSHSSGAVACISFAPSTSIAASRIRGGSVPTSRLVPLSMVPGLSVFSRTVRQGTPRIVVSS